MNSKDVRNSFLDFFRKKNHEIVPSAPVVPFDDPTLLFTNAGMNQFKNIFLGNETRSYNRAADTQKCIRVSGKHNDLEDVGFDTYHHTLFEMLGNWSFGDYFKAEAIEWAWELLTDVWKLPKDRLYATVFGGDAADGLDADTEAADLWRGMTDIEPGHVLLFGRKDNFWEMGETGPCGPCSEIHIDLTPDKSGGKLVNADSPSVIEIWNLVFIQFNRDKSGKLATLPAKHVDTGMGFERICAVINGTSSNYDTDLFTPILAAIDEMSGIRYSKGPGGIAHRVIADHVRALAFAIADGAMPSNEGRGYVLRRILRRAARFGRNINMKEPFIWRLVPVLVDIMGETFPELKEKHQFVSMVVKSEEEGFNSTLDRGLEIFEKIVDQLEKKGGTEIPGSEAFKLYDTYGFPLDLTQLMARQKNLTVDEAGFNAAMKGQRERARSAGKWSYSAEFEYKDWKTLSEGPDSKFVGYETLETEANIRKYQIDGEQIFVTLDLTPFYGEAGGQVGDVGEILGDGFKIRVSDTIRDGNTFVHIGKIDDPTKLNSAAVKASVDAMHRKSVARNHTATHLLHKALRETLGTHVTQAGSLVAPDHLRFDVTHFQKISAEELEKIEARVNQKVREDLAISISQKSYVEARELGAMAIFEEKYGDVVRVVQIDSFSMELCGGTHLKHTGEIGYFRILSESSAAAGIRRLEAVTGRRSDEMLRREKKLTTDLLEVLNCKPDEAVGRIRSLLEEKAQLEKEIKKLRVQSAGSQIEALVSSSKEIDGFRVVASRIDSDDAEELKQIGDELRLKIGSGVGVLASASGTKVSFICVVTDNLIKEKNLRAGDIVKKVAALAGGGGGGRPHMALAGGKDVSKVKLALESVDQIIREFL
jgi:alanyl-tRNA synthetase